MELNGMPRWVAFEELFVIAEEGAKVTAAMRHRKERRRLLLGLFIADPWRDERRLRAALNAGAATLACELGRREVLVETGQGVRETLGKPSDGVGVSPSGVRWGFRSSHSSARRVRKEGRRTFGATASPTVATFALPHGHWWAVGRSAGL